MLANIITILLLAAWVAFSVWSFVRDKKNGVPTCGYACAGCSGSCSRGVRSAETKVSQRKLREIRRSIRKREASLHEESRT